MSRFYSYYTLNHLLMTAKGVHMQSTSKDTPPKRREVREVKLKVEDLFLDDQVIDDDPDPPPPRGGSYMKLSFSALT